jgi:hypothetical protein
MVQRLCHLRLSEIARANSRAEMLDRLGELSGLVGLYSGAIELLARGR